MAAIQYRQFPGPGIYTLQYAAGNLPTAIDIYCGGGGAGGQGIGLGGRGGGGGGGGRGVASSVVVGQQRQEASNERGARGGSGHCTIVQYFPN